MTEQALDEMDESSFWQEFRRVAREDSSQRRHANRRRSTQILQQAGVSFEAKNEGAHLIVKHGDKAVDFWPGTGLWIDRSGKKCRGVFVLLKHLGVARPA